MRLDRIYFCWKRNRLAGLSSLGSMLCLCFQTRPPEDDNLLHHRCDVWRACEASYLHVAGRAPRTRGSVLERSIEKQTDGGRRLPL